MVGGVLCVRHVELIQRLEDHRDALWRRRCDTVCLIGQVNMNREMI